VRVPGGQYDSSLTRVQPFFTALFTRDPSGRSWLSKLLAATPNGVRALGDLVDAPGSLESAIAVPGASGVLACFEYPAVAPPSLLAWFIDHPESLVWPKEAKLSAETTRLRRALLYDDPRGSRIKAQERAREPLATRSPFSREWWRFEGVTRLDCVLITDRLVVTVEGKRTEPLSPATEWYPARSQLVRNLEAAKQIAAGRRWASMLLSENHLPEGSVAVLDQTLAESTPHLGTVERDELRTAYLGNLTWREACDAVDVAYELLPDTTHDLA
jgi:hypothetical protein